MKKKLIGLLGGTFDPLHNSHLAAAKWVLKQTAASYIQFIPSFKPPHREAPVATPRQRLLMVTLTISNEPNLCVNDCEIQRGGTSYTYDTLVELTTKKPQDIYALILGTDAFNQFNTWKNWQQILEKAHLIIINRPDHELAQADWLKALLAEREVTDANALFNNSSGKIFQLTIPPEPYSATEIRENIAAGKDVSQSIPETVRAYIESEKLYRESK